MTQESDEAAVRAVIDARRIAIRNGNAAGVIAPLATDVIVYDLQPPLAFRGGAARDTVGLEQWFATWQELPSVELTDPSVAIDGDLAVVHGLSHMTGVKVDDGAVDLWYRTTIVLGRRSDQWCIVHEHLSVPFMMDGTFKAAIDLKP